MPVDEKTKKYTPPPKPTARLVYRGEMMQFNGIIYEVIFVDKVRGIFHAKKKG